MIDDDRIMSKCPKCTRRFYVRLSMCGPCEQWVCHYCYYEFAFDDTGITVDGYTDEMGSPVKRRLGRKRILTAQRDNLEHGGLSPSTYRRLVKVYNG
jgi:hypothetical protein